MSAVALRAATIVGELRDHDGAWLTIERGVITGFATDPPSMPSIDLGDVRIIPGLIDIHIHGREGRDVMDADEESLRVISRSLARHGVTGFLATTVTTSWDRTLEALATVGTADLARMPGARMLGAYSEGVFFNVKHKGAHNAAFFLEPSAARIEEMAAAARGRLKVLALAPEIDGAMEALHRATELGVRVVLGHTDATYAQTRAALAAGGCGGVHVFNGMRGIHHREPGCAGAVLLEPGTVEVIADGVHLHPAILQLITRLKAREDVLLISDCMCAGGLDDGAYRLGEMDVVVANGVVRTEAGSLAGSTLTLENAVDLMARNAGIAWRDAVHMASLSAARFLGLDARIGSIATGKDADLAVIDRSGAVVATIVGGALAYVDPDWSPGPALDQAIARSA